jgi:Vacuolar protein sorting-associated protein 62
MADSCSHMQDTDIEPMIVEITDTGKSRLSHGKKIDVIVDALFPHPIRFREVWKQEGGAKSLYIWKPVPPNSAFVVLGMVATNTDEPPKNDTVRCIPRRWTVPTTVSIITLKAVFLTAKLCTCCMLSWQRSVGSCMHAVMWWLVYCSAMVYCCTSLLANGQFASHIITCTCCCTLVYAQCTTTDGTSKDMG